MQLSEALRTYLLQDATFAALIGSRFWPEVYPPALKVELPYVTFHIALRPSEITVTEGVQMIDADVEFTAVSENYDEAFDIWQHLLRLLDNHLGPMVDLEVGTSNWMGTDSANTVEQGLLATISRFFMQYELASN